MTIIVFNDQQNKELDKEYSEKLKQKFRDISGWKIEKDTRIDKELDKFSMGYSKENRDVYEVCIIFKIAYEIEF